MSRNDKDLGIATVWIVLTVALVGLPTAGTIIWSILKALSLL